MNKEFVKYEEALALKELGFDEPCFGCYTKDNELSLDYSNNTDDGHYFQKCSAPLYQQAFRWFRENHKIIVVIDFFNDGNEFEETEFTFTVSDYVDFKTHDTFVTNKSYKTYEEAELACLKKLIEIVKGKK